MTGHRLAIRRFRSRLRVLGEAERAAALGREVDRTVREAVPPAVSRALEPRLGARAGVLRIDRVALTLRLGLSDGFSAAALADALSRGIARAVLERVPAGGDRAQIGPGVAYWPDHDAYAAAYLARRLGLVPGPDWAFGDFRPLDLLAPDEAAVELVSARPEILAALARLVGPGGAASVAARLSEASAARLLERLVLAPDPGWPQEAEDLLTRLIAACRAAPREHPAREALALALGPLAAPPEATAGAVRRTATLARLAVALVAVRDATPPQGGPEALAARLAPEALARLPEPARSLALAAVAPLLAAAPRPAEVAARLARALERSRPRGTTPARPGGAPAALPPLASRVAGLALLIPAALAQGVAEALSPAALHRALAAALGPEAEAAARQDPLLGALVPFDPRDGPPLLPPVPDRLRALVPEPHRDGPAGGEGAAAWGAGLAHAFAARLTGFEGSSLPYLRRQFLARPGRLHAEGRLWTLALDPLPLGVVLRLCGLHGWTGELPWLDGQRLRLQVEEG